MHQIEPPPHGYRRVDGSGKTTFADELGGFIIVRFRAARISRASVERRLSHRRVVRYSEEGKSPVGAFFEDSLQLAPVA